MRALDTNILVRFITNDDKRQVAIVEHLFTECHNNRERLFIPIPVMCELVWVLKYGLSQTKTEIVNVIARLIEDDLFELEQAPLVAAALDRFRFGRAGFADYLIGEIASDAGCRDIVTFDKALKGALGFTVL